MPFIFAFPFANFSYLNSDVIFSSSACTLSFTLFQHAHAKFSTSLQVFVNFAKQQSREDDTIVLHPKAAGAERYTETVSIASVRKWNLARLVWSFVTRTRGVRGVLPAWISWMSSSSLVELEPPLQASVDTDDLEPRSRDAWWVSLKTQTIQTWRLSPALVDPLWGVRP